MPVCKTCNIEKPLQDFEKRSDHNSYRKTCLDCRHVSRNARYQKNRDKELAQAKERNKTNRVQRQVRAKQYYQKNKKDFVRRSEAWRKENPEATSEHTRRTRAKNKSYYQLRESLRGMFRRLGARGHRDVEKLRQRLSVNFKPGMSFDNYGEWEIDHVKPFKRFYEQGITDPNLINALCNLKPLWKSENRAKNSKFNLTNS